MSLSYEAVAGLRSLWSAWPADQQERWEAWLLGRSPVPNVSALPPDSIVSAVVYARNYNYSLAWARTAGSYTTVAPRPCQLWTAVLVRALSGDLHAQAYSASSARAWLIAIERVLCADDPTCDRSFVMYEIKRIPRGSRARNKGERLQDTLRLKELGIELMRLAEQLPAGFIEAALLFRIGLMIALLALRPYRRSVFASIDYVPDPERARSHAGAYLTKQHRTYVIITNRPRVSPGKVFGQLKARVLRGGKFAPLRREVPSELVPFLERWLNHYRPFLIGASESSGLWVSAHGDTLSSIMIYKDICAATRDAFGCSMCPQLFRDAYARSLKVRRPDEVSRAHVGLGHTRRMTHEHYLDPDVRVTRAIGHQVAEVMDSWLDQNPLVVGRGHKPLKTS